MKTKVVTLIVLTLSLVAARAVVATESYPWRDHAQPFDFRFGNHFDMHQQSQLLGNGQLQGFQYIEFTGGYTSEGYPVAMHGQDSVGWMMHGIPGTATLVALGMHHPTWLVNRADLPRQPGYVHFHWVGGPLRPEDIGKTFAGFFLKHTARETFFFPHHESLVTPGIDYNFAPNIMTTWP
jgi:hypothetical protein